MKIKIWFLLMAVFIGDTKSFSKGRSGYARFLNLLNQKFWEPSLYQEVPCLNGKVQSVTLQPGRTWRFRSPNFPDHSGYPGNQKCTWKFKAGHEMIGNVKITCDHFDVDGNLFNGCKDADYMAVKHVTEDWDDEDEFGNEKLCGNLTSWIPLTNFWNMPEKTRRKPKGTSGEVRNIMVRFRSDGKKSGSGFSCRIVGQVKDDGSEATTTTLSTSTTTTSTTIPEITCPEPDDCLCACGRVKAFEEWKSLGDGLKDPSRIVGGQEAIPHQYPWHVGLSSSNYIFCGGTLITQRHVMTAAHCTALLRDVDFEIEDIVVVVSEHDVTSDYDCGYTVRIKNIYIHPDYAKANAFDMDFSIVELAEPIACSDYVSPICLPSGNASQYANRNAIATGWGTIDLNTGEAPTVLHEVGVTTLGQEECKYGTGFDPDLITDNMICAGEVGKDSCYGDSGGPLITLDRESGRYDLIGVGSWGFGCGVEAYPGVYSRTTQVLDWIYGIVGSR